MPFMVSKTQRLSRESGRAAVYPPPPLAYNALSKPLPSPVTP